MSPLVRTCVQWCWALVLFCACADEPTQIVVVVNTDLEAGTDIERVELEVSGATLNEAVPTPRTALLIHKGGELGPIHVMVRGLRMGLRRIEREAVVEFVEGKTLLLNLCLSRDCLEQSCSGSRTCTETGCRSPNVADLPEYNGTIPTSCGAIVGGDGGMVDAAIDGPTVDTSVDTRMDAGPVCTLAGGICNVGDIVMPGDRLDPEPCDGRGAAIDWQWGPAGARAPISAPFVASDPGDYVLEGTQVGLPGCMATLGVTVSDVQATSTDGRTSDTVIDFTAAPGVAFAATRSQEAWAIHPTLGWRDMLNSASGTRPSGDLESVGVIGRRPYFGTVSDESGLYYVMSNADFTTNDWDVLNLPGGDDRGYAVSSRSDASSPTAVAYGEGVAVVHPGGGADMLTSYSAGFDADVAIGFDDPDGYGAIWVLSRSREEVINVDLSGGAELNDGDPVSTDIGTPNAIEVTEDLGVANLWLCGGDGAFMYDLGGAIDIDVPVASPPVAPCHDIAVDGTGGVWVAASSGLQRFDATGNSVANLPVVDGYRHVAFVEGPTGRELWAVTANNDVVRLTER